MSQPARRPSPPRTRENESSRRQMPSGAACKHQPTGTHPLSSLCGESCIPRGLRHRVHVQPLADLRRKADIVFRDARVAVFVDGCFWHGCPAHGRTPNVNQWYWSPKLKRNIERDRDTDRRLTEAGWAVFRVWEHEEMAHAADLIESAVRNRTRHK